MTALRAGFAGRVVRWQRTHGRNSLPWQATRDPYRVWLSEIMLQQTQVSVVVDYYTRFLARFPDVRSLAAAHEDEVLGLWSGLGYYSRARNLHACAQAVMRDHDGAFPSTAQALASLPGIGRSTAAAIASFCFGERAAILDGNVKRVLTRVLGYAQDLANARAERDLWSIAEDLLPTRDLQDAMPRYTQGLMDIGATLCLPRNPSCLLCPLQSDCVAQREGKPEQYPVRTKKLKRSSLSLWLLHAMREDGAVWLERRPGRGIWAGLYCLPVFESREGLEEAVPQAANLQDGEAFLHVLTHKDLHLHPVTTCVPATAVVGSSGSWFGADAWTCLGLPAPVRRYLESAISPPAARGAA